MLFFRAEIDNEFFSLASLDTHKFTLVTCKGNYCWCIAVLQTILILTWRMSDENACNFHLQSSNLTNVTSCSCSRPPQAQTKGQLEILFIIIVYSVAQCSNNQQSISISQFSQIFNAQMIS